LWDIGELISRDLMRHGILLLVSGDATMVFCRLPLIFNTMELVYHTRIIHLVSIVSLRIVCPLTQQLPMMDSSTFATNRALFNFNPASAFLLLTRLPSRATIFFPPNKGNTYFLSFLRSLQIFLTENEYVIHSNSQKLGRQEIFVRD
jgi:hypothetical protein